MTDPYTGIVPRDDGKLRRFQGVGEQPPSPDPQISPSSSRNRLRNYLDDTFNLPNEPYANWEAKRDWIKKDALRQKPDITDNQLESVYKAYGLSRSPGDFNREDSTWGAFRRSMSMAGESVGQLWDAAELKWDAYMGDKEGVVENQRELDESRWEQSLIAQFQSERSSNALTQFMFDLSSSAPLMVGMVAGGAAVAGLAGLAGAPVWLAGLLGYGVIDALVEGQFTFIDVVTDPHVRGKIEKAMGREMTDADIKAISSETQKHLMDHAKTAEDKTRVANFVNPLNYVPFANKLNKLFKVGSAMKGTVRRGATNVAFREGIEEVGQSAVSQKFAGEAKMDALREFKYDPDPRDYDVDWGQAFYEGAMGFVTGAPIGMVSSYRAGKRWEKGQINVDEATGRPIFKDKGEEGFVGKGPLELSVRSIVDSDMPVADKLEGLDRLLHSFKKDGDSREQDILRKEIERMREGKPLMMDKADQEMLSKRKQELAEFKEGKHYDPTKDQDQQGTTGQQEFRIAEPDHREEGRKREILGQVSQSPGIQTRMRKFLNIPKNERTPYQKQFIQFALDPANSEINTQDLMKKTQDRMKEETLQDFELSPEEAAVYKAAQAKQKRFEKADEQLKEELGKDADADVVEETITVEGKTYTKAQAEKIILEKARSVMEENLVDSHTVSGRGSVAEAIDKNWSKELGDLYRTEVRRISDARVKERQAREEIVPPTTTTSNVIYGDTTEAGVDTTVTTTPEAGAEGAPVATEPLAITKKETDKSATATEIINQLKQFWNASDNPPKTDAEWKKLNSDIRGDINKFGEANFDTITKTSKDGKEYKDWKFDQPGKAQLTTELALKHNIPIPDMEGQAVVKPDTETTTETTTEEVADTAEAVETDKDAPPTLYNADNNEVKPKLNVDKVVGLRVYHYKPNKTDKGRTYILTERQYTAVQKGGDRQVENEVLSAKKDYTAQLYTFWGMDGDTPVFTRGARRSDTKMGRTVDIKDAPNPLINKPKLAQAMLDHLLTGANESFAYPTKKKGEYGWKFQTATDEDIPAINVEAAEKLYKRMQEFGPKVNALAAEEQKIKAKYVDDKGRIKKGQKSKYNAELKKKKIEKKREALRKEAQEIVDEQHRIGFGIKSEKAKLQKKGTKPRKVKENLLQVWQDQVDNDPVFRAELDANNIKWEFSEKKQSEMLGDAITRDTRADTPTVLEPQAAELKKTAILQAELDKKREELAAEAATRQQDAVEEGKELKNWRVSAREKMAKYNSSKLADGLTTTKALEKLRSYLTGKQKNLNDDELLEFLWSKEGRGTKGTPNIASVGNESGQSRDAMTLNQVEATLKNKQNEDPKVYNPKWTKSEKPYKKLAMDFINKEEAPVRPPSKKLTPKGKPEASEVESSLLIGSVQDAKEKTTPKETATETTDVSKPTLTVKELEGLLARNNEADKTSLVKDVTRYKDLTAWDASYYENSEGFTNELKEDLQLDKYPSVLAKEIRKRITDWLDSRIRLSEDSKQWVEPTDLQAEIFDMYWGLLNETHRRQLNKAFKSVGLSGLEVNSNKFFGVKKKPRVGPPRPTAPKSPLSQVAVSATTRVPYKKQQHQRVCWILPSEVTSIFGGATQEFADSLNQNAPFIITDVQNTWRMYTIDTSTGLINPKPLKPPTELTTGAKGLKQDPARLASRKDTETIQSKKLTDEEIGQLMLLEGSERIENRMMDEGLLPFLKLRSVERNLDDIEKIIETVPGDQLWATDYGDKTVEFVEYKDGGRENTTIRFKTDKDAKNFVQRVMQGNPNSAELEQASYGMDKAQQYKEQLAEYKEEQILRRGRRSNIDDAEADELISFARNIADNQPASILTHNNNIGWSETNYNESVLEEIRATKGVDAAKEYLERQNKGEDLDPKELQYLATKSDTVTLSADAKKPTIEEIKNVVFEFNKKHPGIINNLSLVVDPNHPVSKDKRGIKGAYQESTDTIILVANNLSSKADVAMTLFHEGVGHRSYKNPHTNILTTETRAELEDLVKNSFPEEYAHEVGEQLKALDNKEAQLEPNMDRDQTAHTRAAQEVLAHKIETMTDEDFNPTFVEKLSYWIRKVIRDFLEGIGIGTVNLNDNDVKVLYSRLAKDLKKVTKPISELDIGRLSKLPEDVMYRADLSLEERFNGFDVTRDQAIFLDKVYPVYDKGNTVSIMKRLWQSFNHKVFDPYLVIKREVGIVPYMVARLSNRADGILTTILQHAGVKVEKEKVDGILISNTVLDRSKKSFNAAIKPLGTETERKKFFAWMAAKRAAILKAEDPTKEQYFSDAQIRDGVTLNTGTMKDATTGVQASRQQIYNRVSNDIAALNDSMVKLGIDMGLFDPKYAKQWQTAFYVPFYRHFETQVGDNQFKGAANYNSLVNQKGVYELHGSEKGITDPMNNLLHNWLHIIDASIKNHSAKVVMDKASGMIDPVTSLPSVQKVASSNARSVRILRDGKEEHYVVNNQLLFDSLTTLSNDSKFPMFGLGIKAKNIFTRIITSSPVFKFWSNIIRDTMGAAGTTDLGFNLWKNAVGGFRSLKDVQADMLVTGGYIQFGNIRSDDPNYAEKILGKELTSGYIVANPEKNEKFQAALKKGWKMMGSVWRSYEKLGDKMENANRAALFNATLSKSKSKLKAAFEARDLMDFTLHGGSKWVRTVTSLMPFSNAMLQGKYKLARSMKDHPEAVATLAGMTILVSLFEYFMWGDDEDWNARPDWDRDSYFQVKIPGTDTIFKIPKPHEFAMVGNLAVRGIMMAKMADPVHGELLASAIRTAVFREFDTTPLPHFIKPFIEIGMNENLYFNKPIESKGMQHLSPENRKSLYTSDTAGLISGILQHIPNVLPFAESAKLSPVQIDHVANAYFGYLGGLVLTATDAIIRMAGDYPVRPARPMSEHPYVRKVITSGKLRNTKYAQMYYDRLAEADQAYADLQYYQRLGQFNNYRKLYKEKRHLLAFRDMIKGRRRDLNDLNARIKYNRLTTTRGEEQKAVMEDRLYQIRNLLFKIISTWPSLR